LKRKVRLWLKTYQILVVVIAPLATIACSSGKKITETTGGTASSTTPVATSTSVQQMATQAATATQTALATQTVAATRTATPTKVATSIVRSTPVVELTSSDADCENMGTHIYCLSSQLTAPTGAILTWGELTGESPEIFCAVDATVQVCEWVANGLLSAIRLWGNYAPMEYWVLGTELAAADDLTA
jgi:hypothetical protein|tara:strand:+ start:252 stop:812 length:561 start_codon:yes stop_codon:yes gene_type:complete